MPFARLIDSDRVQHVYFLIDDNARTSILEKLLQKHSAFSFKTPRVTVPMQTLRESWMPHNPENF